MTSIANTIPSNLVNTIVITGPQGSAGPVRSIELKTDGTIKITGNIANRDNPDALFNIALPQSIASNASPTFDSLHLTGNLVVSGTTTGISAAMVGLGSVDNTADLAKPISTATQSALDAKQPLDATLTGLAAVSTAANTLVYATGVDSFATTPITEAARLLLDDVSGAAMRVTLGLGNVTNESKATMFASPTFTGTVSGITAAMTGAVPTTQLGAVNGVATLDANGVLSSAQIPNITITNTFVVASESAMLALTAQTGDVAIRSDTNTTYILKGASASTLADWQLLLTPTASGEGAVLSVAGRIGAVTLTKADVGLSSVDNTADTAKPVSTATQTALDLKANIASPTFTGTVGGITAAMVGLGNVNNTADIDKPISTAVQTALNAKGDVTTTGVQTLTNKTFTGYTETVYALTGTDISAANGTIQYKTLTANTTFTESLADGQSVTLMINPVTYTVTWPTTTWIGSVASTAPTLIASVYNCITLFQIAGVLYGKYEGRV